MELFPNLYSVSTSKDAKVADMWNTSSGVGIWHPQFLRPLNDREVIDLYLEMVVKFY